MGLDRFDWPQPHRSQAPELRPAPIVGRELASVGRWLSADAVQAYEEAFQAGDGVVDNAELSSILFGIWTAQLMAMDLGKARGTVQEMLQRAQGSGDADLVVEAHVAMANTLFWLGTVLKPWPAWHEAA